MGEMNMQNISEAANRIIAAQKATALTGAGISVASGIMPFRGEGGLWEKYDPEEIVEINSFLRHPAKSWAVLKEMQIVIEKALPNEAHYSLAKMEEIGFLKSIITQNIDGLHQAAGSKRVIEFHGNNRRLICLECKTLYPSSEISLDTLPPLCPKCQGLMKPDAVFFGESIPLDAIQHSRSDVQQCKTILAIGTSALVEPAASLPLIGKRNGAFIIEINPEETPLTDTATDLFVKGKAEEILPKIVEKLLESTKK